jgi:uncharacterized membrane protein
MMWMIYAWMLMLIASATATVIVTVIVIAYRCDWSDCFDDAVDVAGDCP